MRALNKDYSGLSQTDLAYAAGIVDGEGCISIRLHKKRKASYTSYVHALTVSVSSIDECLIEWLHVRFGGHRSKTKPKHGSQVYAWRIESRACATFLETILPYLLVKTPQAKIAVEFQSHVLPKGGRMFKLSTDTIAMRDQYRVRIHELNSTRGDQFRSLADHVASHHLVAVA